MIGLDIGTYYIKLACVEKRGNGYHVTVALMTRNVPSPLTGKNESDITLLLKKLLMKAKLGESSAALAFCSNNAVSRNFEFPKMTRDELQGALQLELGQASSINVNAMYSDFIITTPEAAKQSDILFVATPKDEVNRWIQIVSNAGLDAKIVDIGNCALANAFLMFDPNPAKESVVLIDIGHTFSTISIIDNDELRFIRTIDCGGKDITGEISRYLGISRDIAETVKQRPEIWGGVGLNIKNILKKSMPDLLEGVYRSIEYCMGRKKLPFVDQVLLTGGSSTLPGIDRFFAESLGYHTKNWNPLLLGDSHVQVNSQWGQFLSVALGLAVRDEKNS